MNIRDIVQNSDTVAGRAFDFVALFLIVFSMIAITFETLPNLPPIVKTALGISEVVITVLFTIEYVLRIATSPKKTDYIFSFYGIIDLVAVLPFYLSLGIDLRSVRAFRLFRIVRILKLTGYNSAMARFGKAISYAREEATIFFFATIILLYLSAVGIYYFEHDAQPENFRSIFHSLWWAIATLTTVGYGDVYPVELTRFRGHLQTVRRRCSDAKDSFTLRAGVPAPDGRVGSLGPYARGAGPGVRVFRFGDSQLGAPG